MFVKNSSGFGGRPLSNSSASFYNIVMKLDVHNKGVLPE